MIFASRSRVDWWRLWHGLLRETGWGPERIGALTLVQVLCLGSERSPDAPAPITTAEEYLAREAREREKTEKW